MTYCLKYLHKYNTLILNIVYSTISIYIQYIYSYSYFYSYHIPNEVYLN